MPYAMFWMRERSDLSWSSPLLAARRDRGGGLRFVALRGRELRAQRREVGVQQAQPALRVAQRFDAHVGERFGLRRHALRRGGEVLLALRDLAERELRLAELEARGRVVGAPLEHVGELHRRDVVAAGLEVVDPLRDALVVGAQRRVELGIAVEVREPLRRAGMVGEILRDEVVAAAVDRAEVRHERPHRVGIVAGARHQHQTVLVGFVLVVARDLRLQTRLRELAEAVHERDEQRRDAEDHVEDRRLVVRGDRVAALDVARLVADDAGELVVALHEVQRAFVDVDVAAERRERVDVGHVEDLDRVRHVLARRLRPQLVRHVVDPLVEQRIGDDHGRVGDLLVVLLAELDFGRGRHGKSGCRDAGTHHRYGERDDDDTAERHGRSSGFGATAEPGSAGSAKVRNSPLVTHKSVGCMWTTELSRAFRVDGAGRGSGPSERRAIMITERCL